jgi:hypothetical protein
MTDLKTIHQLSLFKTASFTHAGEETFGTFKTAKAIGIWDSDVIDGTEYLLIWKALELSSTLQSNNDRVYTYIRSGSTSDLTDQLWEGPVSQSISKTSRFIQIRLVIVSTSPINAPYPTYQSDKIGPTIDRLTLKGTASSTADLFFSKTFDIGFAPKSIVLTHESDVPEGSILRFGVTSLDSVNLTDYQFIDANKAVNLDQLSVTGEKIKFVIEMSGNSNDEVVVHEFAAFFGGDENNRLNQ